MRNVMIKLLIREARVAQDFANSLDKALIDFFEDGDGEKFMTKRQEAFTKFMEDIQQIKTTCENRHENPTIRPEP